MKLFFMMAYCRCPDANNPVMVELIDILRRRSIQVDLGVAQDLVLRPGRMIMLHDLYILKSHSKLWLSLAGVLHEQGARILNPYPACAMVENKIVTTQRLQAAGIPIPNSWVTGDLELLKPIVSDIPLVIKPYVGGRGAGIYFVKNPEELMAVPPPQQPVLVQEFIQGSGEDLKVYVINDQVFAIRKPFSPTSYRFIGEQSPVSSEVRQIALNCGKSVGLSLYGLDIIEGPNGPIVVDLNYFPSFKGVPNAADLLSEYIISYAYDQSPNLAITEMISSLVSQG